MGHLFAAGGATVEGDGVRELYVGTLAHVRADVFPSIFRYVALGHLHRPQTVRGATNIRYSGSPIAMGFSEANHQKSVCILDASDPDAQVRLVPIPVFQRLESISGDLPAILSTLQTLSTTGESVWVDVTFEGNALVPDLREQIDTSVANSRILINRVRPKKLIEAILEASFEGESLVDLSVDSVFERRLATLELEASEAASLREGFAEICATLNESSSTPEESE
jgi:exonuclease SbcD